jgi:hypothetical protein
MTWSYPNGTVCGTEVDAAELLGRTPYNVPETDHGCTGQVKKVAAISTSIANWHTYAAAVYTDRTVFYIDGKQTYTVYNTQVPSGVNRTVAFDLSTNLKIGLCGSWAACPTVHTTQYMFVDYLKAWT